MAGFDVFLCHNSADKDAVKEIGRGLQGRGLRPWLDEWDLQPGKSWLRQLESQIETIRAAAVFVGESGIGPWQTEEVEAFLQQCVQRGCPVIPVILNGCADAPKLPLFLANRHWIDFRQSEPDPWRQLIWGITGEKPSPDDDSPARSPSTEAPEPAFLDERSRELSRTLEDAYRREGELIAQGADPSKVRDEILAIQREMREDGLRPGDILSRRYRLIEPIGQGGFARVWRAWDSQLRQLVAIKALHQQFAREGSRQKRFFRGARRMARLNHPGITSILGEPEMRDGACRYFVMEYAEGGDLRQAVLDGKLDIDERLRVIHTVGAALDYAHQRGIVHRDVKPANILLDGRGEPKLTDFDLVRAQDSTGGTRTGMLGTVVYAAPEAMERAKEAGVAADVYGLGMTAIFALHGDNLPARDLLRDAPGFAQRLDTSAAVREALARAVAWEAEERQASVAELCAELVEAPTVADVMPPQAPSFGAGTDADRPTRSKSKTTVTEKPEDEIAELLNMADDWQERSQVFRRIPELFNDPEATLQRIDRLRRGTSEVHDLFFLEESAREVAARLSESARSVAELRTRFYADREPPPEELFSQIETPHGKQIPLWRDIEAGTFLMGSPDSEPDFDESTQPLGAFSDERPQHDVRISRPLRMMVVPVTNAMYQNFDPSHEPQNWRGVGEDQLAGHPAVNIDWYQASAFCRWLARHGFDGARLPTEAEWEYACRAGKTTRFWSGDQEEDLERVAWYEANAPSRTHCVGEKPANPWGLYDMHGNVWEWCTDGWDADAYSQRTRDRAVIDPKIEADVWDVKADRVLRGGAWGYPPLNLRAASRSRVWSWNRSRFGNLGFRVCCSGPEHA